ncbi:MAG: TlpA disulfide reductase family protein [Bacteroidales bacterium]
MMAQTPDARGYLVKVGQKAPNITLKKTDGTKIRLSDLHGQVVMLQFTASWCGVCRRETPFIEKDIWQVYKEKGLLLFGVDRGEPLEKVEKFAQDMNISYPLTLDEDSEIFGSFADKSAGVTRNVLIDRDGKIVLLTRLFDETEFEELKRKIGELLK